MVEGLLVVRSWENKHLLPSRHTPWRKYLQKDRKHHQNTRWHMNLETEMLQCFWMKTENVSYWNINAEWRINAWMSKVWCDICSRTCVSPATPFSLMPKSWRCYQWPYLIQRCFDGCVMAVWRFSLPAGHLFRWHDYNPATNAIFLLWMLLSTRFCATWKYHRLHRGDADHCFRRFISASRFFWTDRFIALAQLLVRIKFLFGYVMETFSVCWNQLCYIMYVSMDSFELIYYRESTLKNDSFTIWRTTRWWSDFWRQTMKNHVVIVAHK